MRQNVLYDQCTLLSLRALSALLLLLSVGLLFFPTYTARLLLQPTVPVQAPTVTILLHFLGAFSAGLGVSALAPTFSVAPSAAIGPALMATSVGLLRIAAAPHAGSVISYSVLLCGGLALFGVGYLASGTKIKAD